MSHPSIRLKKILSHIDLERVVGVILFAPQPDRRLTDSAT